jgi:serine/threonine protein kinase/Tol biopolymer transport system component
MSESLREQLQTTLGDAYKLERELGGGGMSRVFVADDATLGRKIVVKVLPHDTAVGVSAERFKREIQTAARLQHPHIVPLLSAGETNGLPFYTMPFVKGESLRARLTRGGELSVNEAVHVLRDGAGALAYAHGEGVVHRDIKPDNVILSGGVAVVTDFGVSKAVDIAATESGGLMSGLTSLGVALGTPAYMSPEQASADPHVDHRADVYSFGCVAYELLSGASPFAGRSAQHMLSAHVTEVPDPLIKRRPNVPPALSALVMKCLEKHAGDRPQSADELLNALDALGTPSGGMAPTDERLEAVRRRRPLWITGAAVAAALLIFGAWSMLRGPSGPSYSLGTTIPIAISPEIEGEPAISPDGKLVAYVATTAAGTRIFVRQVEAGRANLLTGEVDGTHSSPQWSPDQQRVSFHANGALFVIPALGGSPKRVASGGPTHSWSPDGNSLVYEAQTERGIWIQSLSDGSRRRVVEGAQLHSPALSRDGRLLAYVHGQPLTLNNTSTNAVWIVAVAGGTPVRVSDSTHVNVSPVWAPDDKSLLYISNVAGSRDVYQQSLRRSGNPVGSPRRITTGLSSFFISISRDGSRITYDLVRNYSNIWTSTIAPRQMGSFSSARPLTRENQRIEQLSLSHDGEWLAYDSDRAGNFDIYKVRSDGGEPIQLTTSAGNDFGPAWSPDGREIAFHSHRSATRDLYVIGSEGGIERQVTSGLQNDFNPIWSPDGRKLLYYSLTSDSIGAFIIERDPRGVWSSPRRVTPPDVLVLGPRWSPDGSRFVHLQTDIFGAGETENGSVAITAASGGASRVVATPATLLGSAQSVEWPRTPSTVYVGVQNASGGYSIWAVPLNGRPPRRILAEDSTHRFGRAEFATDGRRFFFTLASTESDVYVAELKP